MDLGQRHGPPAEDGRCDGVPRHASHRVPQIHGGRMAAGPLRAAPSPPLRHLADDYNSAILKSPATSGFGLTLAGLINGGRVGAVSAIEVNGRPDIIEAMPKGIEPLSVFTAPSMSVPKL